MKKQKRGQFKPLKNMKAVLDIWCNGREEKDVLFPGWDAKKACGIIRECSITHGWDQSVEWDGPHTERYGASRESELFQEDEIMGLNAMPMATHCSVRTTTTPSTSRRR